MTNVKSPKKSFQNSRPFIESLEEKAGFKFTEDLSKIEFDERKINRAALADLRRDVGKPPNKSIFAMKYLSVWTENFDDDWDTECYYIIGSLFAVFQQKVGKNEEVKISWHHQENSSGKQRNLGESFHRLEKRIAEERGDVNNRKEKLKTVEDRFTKLIRSRRSEISVQLRYAILLLASYEVAIDWVELLRDLIRWKHFESPFVKKGISPQRSWSESFWKITEDYNEIEILEEK